MRKLIMALALGSAALAFGSVEASAYDYAYCLVGRGYGSPGDCAYSNYAQCMASASGRGLSCIINPRVAFARQGYYNGPGVVDDEFAPPPPRRRYRRQYVPY